MITIFDFFLFCAIFQWCMLYSPVNWYFYFNVLSKCNLPFNIFKMANYSKKKKDNYLFQPGSAASPSPHHNPNNHMMRQQVFTLIWIEYFFIFSKLLSIIKLSTIAFLVLGVKIHIFIKICFPSVSMYKNMMYNFKLCVGNDSYNLRFFTFL